jgi:hypothetical protein
VTAGGHFEWVAVVYESLRTTDEAPVRRIGQLLPDRPVTALDIGCGTGRYTRLLRRLLPEGSRLVASDVSAAMLSQLEVGNDGHARGVVPLLHWRFLPPAGGRLANDRHGGLPGCEGIVVRLRLRQTGRRPRCGLGIREDDERMRSRWLVIGALAAPPGTAGFILRSAARREAPSGARPPGRPGTRRRSGQSDFAIATCS